MILPTIKLVCETPPGEAKQTITVSLEYADDPRRSLHMSVTDMQHATDAMEFLTQAIRDIRVLNEVPQSGACCDSGYLGGNFLDGAACGDRQSFEASKHMTDPMTGKQYTGTIDLRASVKRAFPVEGARGNDAWAFGVPDAFVELAPQPDLSQTTMDDLTRMMNQEMGGAKGESGEDSQAIDSRGYADALARMGEKIACETCVGRGNIDSNIPCPTCGGTGMKSPV